MNYKLQLAKPVEVFFRYDIRLSSREAHIRFWFKLREDLFQQAQDWQSMRYPDDERAFVWRMRFNDDGRWSLFTFAINDQSPGVLIIVDADQREEYRPFEEN